MNRPLAMNIRRTASLQAAVTLRTAALLLLILTAGAYAQRVKVNKELVGIIPSAKGETPILQGEPGAVTNAGDDVILYAENLRNKYRVDMLLAKDGSFRAVLDEAQTGDQIRVYAVRPRVNRSYGTFVVPPREQGEPTAADEDTAAVYHSSPAAFAALAVADNKTRRNAAPAALAPVKDPKAAPAKLTVIALVIDTDTGQVVDNAHVSGATLVPIQNPDQLRGLASRLLDRCLAMTKKELRTPSAIVHQEGPNLPAALPLNVPEKPLEKTSAGQELPAASETQLLENAGLEEESADANDIYRPAPPAADGDQDDDDGSSENP